MALAEIAHVRHPIHNDVGRGDPLCRYIAMPGAFKLVPGGQDLFGSSQLFLADKGSDVITGEVANMQAEGAQIARIGWRNHRGDAKKISNFGGEQPAGAAE